MANDSSKPVDQKAAAVLAVCEGRIQLTLGLAPFIDAAMKKQVGQNWLDVVRNRRPADAAPSSLDDATTVADLDDSILLRTMENFWIEVFRKAGLKDSHRNLVTTCLVARNQSAHPTARMIEPQAARSYLVAIHQLLEAIGSKERCATVIGLKNRISDAPLTPSRGEELKFELHALEERIREQLKSETEVRTRSGQKAGQDLMDRLGEHSALLKEIKGMLAGKPAKEVVKPEPVSTPTSRVPLSKPNVSMESASWQIRRNANGSVGAVATTRDGQTVRRLALTPAEARRILGAELVDAAWHAQGGWVFVPAGGATQLDDELTRRLAGGEAS